MWPNNLMEERISFPKQPTVKVTKATIGSASILVFNRLILNEQSYNSKSIANIVLICQKNVEDISTRRSSIIINQQSDIFGSPQALAPSPPT